MKIELIMLFKRIDGFEKYWISFDGMIYNEKTNKFLKHQTSRNKYLNVELTKGNKRYTMMVHRLIALAFIPNPNNYEFIDHIDRNKRNNDINNLRWVNKQQR